ncbi:hypothetical protein BA726_18330 [Klebsiella pneumoniae]|nr:hypothetical protein BA726_18330 [Klebsiella pneumoniae]
MLSHTNDSGVNKVILRYSDNSDNSVYNKTDDLTTVYASFEGSHKFTQQAQVEYLLAFHDYDNGRDNTDNRKNYGAIVRPMYFWNDVYSTWLEAGYQRVDYDQGGDNHGWKLTLSQNIAIGMGPEFRPMLRFYVTGGHDSVVEGAFPAGATLSRATTDALHLCRMAAYMPYPAYVPSCGLPPGPASAAPPGGQAPYLR